MQVQPPPNAKIGKCEQCEMTGILIRKPQRRPEPTDYLNLTATNPFISEYAIMELCLTCFASFGIGNSPNQRHVHIKH